MNKIIYTWFGGYSLYKCDLNEETQENLNDDDMEAVLCYLINTDQIDYELASEFEKNNDIEELEGWIYIDNTCSDAPGKNNCYYVCIENMKIIEN